MSHNFVSLGIVDSGVNVTVVLILSKREIGDTLPKPPRIYSHGNHALPAPPSASFVVELQGTVVLWPTSGASS